MGLPPARAKPHHALPQDDPMNKALQQLAEYEEGTPKRTTKDHLTCCVIDHHAHGKKED